MNSYPLGVSELLLAPPPPPPPTLPLGAADTQHAQTVNLSKTQLAVGVPGHSQVPPMHMHHSLPPQNLPLPAAMNLSLPPPPPPPPPEAGCNPSGAGIPHCMPFPNHLHHVTQNYPMQNNRRAHSGGKPCRGGSSLWAAQKQGPSGLQGPWQAPSEERPSGVFQELHPPGVPSEPSVGVDQSGDLNVGLSAETAGPEMSNSMSPTFSKAASTYKDHKVDPRDSRLPKELTNLFEALHCKLCEVLSSSTVQAKHHYSGKPHEKKVRQWLLKWSEETGQPMPKRQKVDTTVADVNPEDLYCSLCEVAFTSVKHGEQHRMGKPHQKALRLGYSTAKSKAKKMEVPFDPTGRFGIGEGFLKTKIDNCLEPAQSETKQEVVSVASEPPITPATAAPVLPPLNSKFYCDLCKISATSQDHLDSHFVGAKHRKALVNAAKAGIKPEFSVVPPPVEPAESILTSIIKASRNTITNDLSIYRTPSGQYYCHPCNTTVNSEKSFREHTESKRHKFKLASSKRS